MLSQNSGGIHINLCQQLMKLWITSCSGRKLQIYRVWSRQIVAVLSQILKEVGWSVFSFITVIKIMSVLAAGWRIRCMSAWTLAVLLPSSKGQHIQHQIIILIIFSISISLSFECYNSLRTARSSVNKVKLDLDGFQSLLLHSPRIPSLTVGIRTRSDRC